MHLSLPQLGLATTTMSRSGSSSSKSNKAGRGGNFTRDEVDSLLDSVEEVMPIGMDEWALVERRHMASYPDRNRTKESLRRKFQLLYLSKQQTGQPECPPEVRRAKSLQYAIREKAEVSSAGSESVISTPGNDEEQAEASNNDDSSPTNNNMVETTESETTRDTTRRPSQGLFETPVARVGKKRRKRVDDDDEDVTIKDLMKYTMVQQQQDREESRKDRQMMMQMMSMAMMSMVSNNSRNSSNNEHLVQMMESFNARQQTSNSTADGSTNPQPAGTATAPVHALDDVDVTTDINIE